MNIDFSDLETNLDDVPTVESTGRFAKTEKFPCEKCAGKGVYTYGYVNVRTGKCFACNGKGFFLTSRADREKAKVRRAKRAEAKRTDHWEEWAAANPVLAPYLLEVASWNNFAVSMIDGVKKYGSLTENMEAAVERMHAKHLARIAEREKSKVEVNLGRVAEIFASARESGLKRPKLRVGELVLMWGKNDAIYVKGGSAYHDPYYGKVVDGLWHPARDATPEVTAALVALAADPLAEAVAYGRRTGNCAACGRELTVKESIDRGIGPICFEKWGF